MRTTQPIGPLVFPVPWGLVLITDEGARDEIPAWQSADETVTASAAAVACRVVNGQFGVTTVEVWAQPRACRDRVFAGSIVVRSGRLQIGDALSERTIVFEVTPGPVQMTICADRPTGATHIDVILAERLIQGSPAR